MGLMWKTGTGPLRGRRRVQRPEPQAEAPSWPKHCGWRGQASLPLVSAAQVLRPSAGWELGDTSLARAGSGQSQPARMPSEGSGRGTGHWAALLAITPGCALDAGVPVGTARSPGPGRPSRDARASE